MNLRYKRKLSNEKRIKGYHSAMGVKERRKLASKIDYGNYAECSAVLRDFDKFLKEF